MVVVAVSVLGTLLLSTGTALAYDAKGGTISADTTWPAGTYHVVSNVAVNNGVTLTIQAGAVVKFDPGTELKVYGKLDANGTSVSPVVFASRDDNTHGESVAGSDGDPNPGDWKGVYLPGSSSYTGIGEFDYVRIRYGGASAGIVDANVYYYLSDSGYFRNGISEHSAQHGVRAYVCSPTIEQSTFHGNANHGSYAWTGGAPTVTGNSFTDNGEYGAI